jgi:hypothetical protein
MCDTRRDCCVCCLCHLQLKLAYGQADKQGIPVHLQGGDFYDSIEIKTALALLRAVVYPEAASEGLKRRVIMGSAEVKLPLTRGLGEIPSSTALLCRGSTAAAEAAAMCPKHTQTLQETWHIQTIICVCCMQLAEPPTSCAYNIPMPPVLLLALCLPCMRRGQTPDCPRSSFGHLSKQQQQQRKSC